MFELNLIKDKAQARRRRQVIFMSIVFVVLFSGLVSIFVGSLYYRERFVLLATVNNNVETLTVSNRALDTKLKVDQPAAKKRRNAMIDAWNEDMQVLNDSPKFTPALDDLSARYPQTAEFWYNQIMISANNQGAGPRGTGEDSEGLLAKALLGSRSFEANGYIEIEASDILTESELRQLSQQMNDLTKLVGEPTFNVDVSQEIIPGGDIESNRYVPFTVQAAQTTFREGP